MKEFEQITVALAIAHQMAAAINTKRLKYQLRILLNTVNSNGSELTCKTKPIFQAWIRDHWVSSLLVLREFNSISG